MKEKGESARQGKIARLPAEIREQINLRLLDGQSGSKLLPWLNALPEVIRLLEEDAEGLRISDNNLSNWRKGGYADWLKRRERLARTKDLADWSVKIATASGGKLAEGGAAILSGQVLEVLEDLTADRTDDTEKPDPAKIAEALGSIGETLSALRTGDQNNVRLKQNDERLDIMRKRLDQTEQSLELERKKFQRSTPEMFLKWAEDERARGILALAINNDEKTERLGQLMFGEDWKA